MGPTSEARGGSLRSKVPQIYHRTDLCPPHACILFAFKITSSHLASLTIQLCDVNGISLQKKEMRLASVSPGKESSWAPPSAAPCSPLRACRAPLPKPGARSQKCHSSERGTNTKWVSVGCYNFDFQTGLPNSVSTLFNAHGLAPVSLGD